jgi:hypothetical protein
MAARNVFGHMMSPDVEEYVWHLYHKMQQAIKAQGLMLMDKMSFQDFVNVCYKYTSGNPSYINEGSDDDDEYVHEEAEAPGVKHLGSLAESEMST